MLIFMYDVLVNVVANIMVIGIGALCRYWWRKYGCSDKTRKLIHRTKRRLFK